MRIFQSVRVLLMSDLVLSVQVPLFVGLRVGVPFSSELFCRFLRCIECCCYVVRYDNYMRLLIGEVVPYTFLNGDVICIECFHKLPVEK